MGDLYLEMLQQSGCVSMAEPVRDNLHGVSHRVLNFL